MQFAFNLLILASYSSVTMAEAENRTTDLMLKDSSSMWTNILELTMEKLEETIGSCATLYNFEASLIREIKLKQGFLGGLFVAEKLENTMRRKHRRRPLCQNLLAKFSRKNDAMAFAKHEKESGIFLRASGLAVIFVAESLTRRDMSQLYDLGSFGRTPQLTFVAKVGKKNDENKFFCIFMYNKIYFFAKGEKRSTFELYARDLLSIPTQPLLIARWNDLEQSFVFGKKDIFSVNLNNFHGRTLQIATFDYAPFTTSKPALDGQSPVFDGIEVNIMILI